MNFLFVAKKVFGFWKANPLLFVASMALDALFLPVYGFVTGPIKEKIIEHVLVISSLASQSAKETGSRAVQSGQSIVAMMLSEPVVSHYAYRALILFILLAIGTYVVYVLVQGMTWFVAQRATGQHLTAVEYVARFARVNVWWGILASTFSVISLLASIRNAVATALASKQQTDIVSGIIYVMVVCLAFIAMWSYSLPHKGSGWHHFKAGWKDIVTRWRIALSAAVIVLASIITVNYAVIGLSYWTPLAALIGGIVLMLPLLAFARVFLIIVRGSHVDA